MKLRQLFVLAVQLAGLLLFAPCASFAEEPAQDGQALDQAANDCSSRAPASTTLQKTMWRPSGPLTSH